MDQIIPLSAHDFQVPSDTRKGTRYHTTRFSCTCPGFSTHGGTPGWTCRHVRRVRQEFGEPMLRFRQPTVALPHVQPDEAA